MKAPIQRIRSRLHAGTLVAIGLVALGGCTTSQVATHPVDPMVLAMYAPLHSEPFPIPAIPVARVEETYYRQTVPTPATISEKPGTIVVDPQNKFLYLVQDGGQSLRYGIGVGRAGFAWTGEATIQEKQDWPKWFPPSEMQARDEKAAKYANGMDGGPDNPIGSRALYLWQDNKDTLYRIHGTFEWQSIGKAVSSGCIRMWNQDIIDLYERVPLETKVVVLPTPGALVPGAEPEPAIVVVPPGSATANLPAGTPVVRPL